MNFTFCEVCKKGIAQGVTLFRQNPKGVAGIWRCAEHNTKPVSPEVADIVAIIEKGNTI